MIADLVPNTAVRKGSAVYVRNLKCASTFFHQNFLAQGWQPTDYCEIDWQRDFVFSHIMDPVIRRHKSLAEYICEVGLGQRYLDDAALQMILTSCLFLDRHGIPYCHAFSGHADQIHWIPLIYGHKQNVQVTQDLLNRRFGFDIQAEHWNFDLAHSTPEDDVKQLVCDQLQKQWESNLYSAESDLDRLWNIHYPQVKDPSWPDCPHARDFYHLPHWIQKELFENFQCTGPLEFILENGNYKLLLYPTSSPPNRVTAAHYAILQADIDLYDHVVKTFSPH